MTSDTTRQTRGAFGGVGPGSRIAGYLVEEQIGAGGMAVVFRARDEVLGRLAAVKIIAPSLADDEEFRARFLRESRMAAKVNSLHIIPVYVAGDDGGLLYIATRYVPGGDLAALTRRSGGTLAPAHTLALVEQVASALDTAHAADLVHRDVKPRNILVDTVPERPEHAFLSDFGLSKGTKSSSTRLTTSGQFLGTPDYASPEQVKGEDVDGRTDQYALACVAFFLLTGEPPFHRGDALATMYAQVEDPVPPLTGLRPELPGAVDGVVARALAKSADERYARCGDFAAALGEALAPASASSARTATAPAAAVPAMKSPAQKRPAQKSPAKAPDPWAWVARSGGPGQAPAGQSARRPPASAARPMFIPAAPSPAPPAASGPQPERADWQRPSLPRALTAGWEAAIRDNAAYAKVITTQRRTGDWRRRVRGRGFRLGVAGGTAAVLAAVGVIYALNSPGGTAPPRRPGEPTLATTLTVPGGGTIGTAWISPDGKFIAASGQGPTIYLWSTANPAKVFRTITPPPMKIGGTNYSPVAGNLAFSADDSTLTGAIYPNVPSGASTPGDKSVYAVYQWNLATGARTTIWSIRRPANVTFNGDDSTALTSLGNQVSLVTLSPELSTAPPATLTGGVDQGYIVPFELDLGGNRMIYHPSSDATYVWDFTSESVVARLTSSQYTVLSPDGKTILAEDPTDYPSPAGAGRPTPMLWDVATRSNVTPTDPRWKQQLRQSWRTYSRDTYSTDGSVILTKRPGGKLDLWSTVTRRRLLTVTDPGYREDGPVIAGPGGSEILILAAEKTANGQREYRQIKVWETPMSPPPVP